MYSSIRILCVLAISLQFFSGAAHCREARSYKQTSKLLIENGRVYHLDPDLYVVLDIGEDKIIKKTYSVKGPVKTLDEEQEFTVSRVLPLKVTSADPKWITDIKKALRRPVPAEFQNVIEAFLIEHQQLFVSMTVGESFLMEVRNFCRYHDLGLTANIVEYGYYERVGE